MKTKKDPPALPGKGDAMPLMPNTEPAARATEATERIQSLTEATISQTDPHVFHVTIIQAGESKNGYIYPPNVIEDATPLFDNAAAFVDHASFEDYMRGTRSVRDAIGAYGSIKWHEDTETIQASLHVLDGQVATLLAKLCEAAADGEPTPNIGISADLTVARTDDIITRIHRVHSADLVFGPAAGGKVHSILEALKDLWDPKKGTFTMTEQKPTYTTAQSPQGEPPAEPVVVSEPVAAAAQHDPTSASQSPIGTSTPDDPQAVAMQRMAFDLEAARQDLCSATLAARLAAESLPQAATDEIRRSFEGRIFEASDLEDAIIRMRALLAQLQPNPVQGHGQPAIVTMDPLARIELAADRLFQVPGTPNDAPRLTGIRELYLQLTGDDELRGIFDPDSARIKETYVTTTTFANVCKNVMNKVLLAAYDTRYRWFEPLIWEEDFMTVNQVTWIKTATIANLNTVAEAAAYLELDSDDLGETSDFLKKGGYIGLTLEAIDRDDVGALRRIPRELGFAAFRTLSALVSAVFTDASGVGPDMADAKAVFHVDHANLLTTALSIDTWETVVQAMFEQADPKNSYVIGLRPAYCVVPIELERTAIEIFKSPQAPGTSDNEINPYFNAGRVVVSPHWTDPNDWAAVAEPSECPGICVGYRYGRQPELFVADQPLVGSMFTNDEIRFKARFFLAVGVADHRPLHKNNVA